MKLLLKRVVVKSKYSIAPIMEYPKPSQAPSCLRLAPQTSSVHLKSAEGGCWRPVAACLSFERLSARAPVSRAQVVMACWDID